MKRMIQASVHDIVDYVFAKGDIIPAFSQKNNMKDGTTVHLEIQRQYTCDKEVYVKFDGSVEDYHVLLQGRIDLLDKIEDHYHIIEIKSTHSFEGLDETTNPAHFAQAIFYGYMMFQTFPLKETDSVLISVMYVHKYSYEKRLFSKNYTFTEMESFFLEVMHRFIEYKNILEDWHDTKLKSIEQLTFPYNYRQGQEELVNEVQATIEANDTLFVCAPTGIGKSLGTIYPTIKTLTQKEEKIFYLTSKSIIKDVARQAVQLLREKSHLQLKSLSLTAKEKSCINHEMKCNPVDCIYARGFFERINEASIDIFLHEDDMALEQILTYSRQYKICPFEFQLNLTLMVDLVICDYNYVYDPRVYLRRFFDQDASHLILLVDEAHNMYDRVCSMYTQKIDYALLHTIEQYGKQDKELPKSCERLYTKLDQYQNHLLQSKKKAIKIADLDPVILDEVALLLTKIEKVFDKLRDKDEEIPESFLFAYFELFNFIKVSEFYSEDFMVWLHQEAEDLQYQITCLNPRALVQMKTDDVKACVFFSATLHPMDYYQSILGGNAKSRQLILDSPFDPKHLDLCVNTHISTKYNDRDMTKYQIAYQIDDLLKRGGKYLVYFPSYQYLEMVYTVFEKVTIFTGDIYKQSKIMTERERHTFIQQFDESKKNIIGFAVLGGVFAEGIDLKGEKLNGVVVVGVGLPLFDDFRNELRAYFDHVYHRGYPFAYVYPGFNKVMQAVGRVIRDEEDKGVALLIDERYTSREYLPLFPKHWSHFEKL